MTPKSGADLVGEAKARIREVTVAESMVLLAASAAVFFDCREPNEYNLGHVPGAVFLPRGNLETKVEAMIPREAKVIIYCATGNRSALAADTMQQMGYADVASMRGGWRDWVMGDGPVDE